MLRRATKYPSHPTGKKSTQARPKEPRCGCRRFGWCSSNWCGCRCNGSGWSHDGSHCDGSCHRRRSIGWCWILDETGEVPLRTNVLASRLTVFDAAGTIGFVARVIRWPVATLNVIVPRRPCDPGPGPKRSQTSFTVNLPNGVPTTLINVVIKRRFAIAMSSHRVAVSPAIWIHIGAAGNVQDSGVV